MYCCFTCAIIWLVLIDVVVLIWSWVCGVIVGSCCSLGGYRIWWPFFGNAWLIDIGLILLRVHCLLWYSAPLGCAYRTMHVRLWNSWMAKHTPDLNDLNVFHPSIHPSIYLFIHSSSVSALSCSGMWWFRAYPGNTEGEVGCGCDTIPTQCSMHTLGHS